MTAKKITENIKSKDLVKYRDLVLATIEYNIQIYSKENIAGVSEIIEHFLSLKPQIEEHFEKGRLTKLKQWFRDLTETVIASNDVKFNTYLKDQTGYDLDIFKSFNQKVEKIITKGKITNDDQFYELRNYLDQLEGIEPVDNDKIKIIDRILFKYEQKK